MHRQINKMLILYFRRNCQETITNHVDKLEKPAYNKYGKLAACNREKADGGELHMKRWKVTFGLFLLLFALATTVACAETKEAKMDWNDRTVMFAQPG